MKRRCPELKSAGTLRCACLACLACIACRRCADGCTGRASRWCAVAAEPHVKDLKRRLSLPKKRCRSLAPPPGLGAWAPLQASHRPAVGLALRRRPYGFAPRRQPMPSHCAPCGRAGCMRRRTSPAWPRTHHHRRVSGRHARQLRHWASCAANFSTSRCTACRSTTASSQNSHSRSCAAAKAIARRAIDPNPAHPSRWRRRILLTPTTHCWPQPGTDGCVKFAFSLAAMAPGRARRADTLVPSVAHIATGAGRTAVPCNRHPPTLQMARSLCPRHADFD